MSRLPLPFGQGLDRETGIMATRPAGFEDLRNLILLDGKAQVRKGFLEKITFASTTHVIAIQPLRSNRTAVVITYDSADGSVDVWGMDAAGENGTSIGNWFTKASDLATPPVVSTAESYGKVFMAHSTLSVTDRAATYVYDRTSSPDLFALQGDLDRDGTDEDIKFRGVVRHLNYLFGWGYGTEKDQERPEILRASLPGEPTEFDPDHYFIVGDRQAPIVAARQSSTR